MIFEAWSIFSHAIFSRADGSFNLTMKHFIFAKQVSNTADKSKTTFITSCQLHQSLRTHVGDEKHLWPFSKIFSLIGFSWNIFQKNHKISWQTIFTVKVFVLKYWKVCLSLFYLHEIAGFKNSFRSMSIGFLESFELKNAQNFLTMI